MSDAYVVLKHRAIFDLYSLREEGNPFMTAAELVIDWLVQKELQYDGSPIVEDLDRRDPFPLAFDYHMPENYQGGDYNEDQWPAVACASQYDEDGALVRWIMEYDEPDAKHDDRRWHSTVCLERMGGRSGGADGDEAEGSAEPEACHVMMQTTCRPLANATEPLPDTIAAPALLRSFINLPWYVAKGGTTQLQTVPNKLSPQTFVHFSEALTDPGRKIPLVLFSTGYDGKIPEQAKQLARRALGNANVYVLDWSNEELREQVQTLFERGTSAGEYACPRSSCRMYMPGVDLSDPHHSMSHESWNREALEKLHPSQFAERLARRFLPSEVVPSIASCGLAGENPEGEGDE